MRVVLPSGESLDVSGDVTIGRVEPNDIVITDNFVSSRHAVLRPAEDGVEVTDLGSRNGTYLNGAPVEGSAIARSGDRIRIGGAELLVTLDAPAPAPAPAADDATSIAQAPAGRPHEAPAVEYPPSPAADSVPDLPPTVTPAARPSPFAPRPAPGGTPASRPSPFAPRPAAQPQMASAPAAPPRSAPVTDDRPHRLLVRVGVDEGREFEIPPGQAYVIGRGDTADIVLGDLRISSRHIRVSPLADGLRVEDLDSANGTLLNGRKVKTGRATEGAEIQVGESVLVYTRQASSAFAGAPQPTIVGGVGLSPGGDGSDPSTGGGRNRRSRGLIGAGALVVVAAAAGGISAAVFGGGGDGGDDEQTPAEIVQAWEPATVRIDVLVDGDVAGGGSGSIIDLDEGLVLTNNHVASVGPLQFQNAFTDGPVNAIILAAAPCDDLALIQYDTAGLSGLRQVEFGDASTLEQGQGIVVMGYPGAAERLENRALSVTSGVVSKVQTVFDYPGGGVPLLPNVIQTDAAINPGNSGGPMFDLFGRQVGVNTAGLAGAGRIENENYAVSIDRVKELLPDLRDGRSPQWIGATFEELFSSETGAPVALGIRDVTPDGPADRAGLVGTTASLPDTLLTHIDGEEILTLQDYCAVMPESGAVTLTFVDRLSGEAVDVDMELE